MNNIKSDMINRDASKEQFIELKKIEIIYSEIISEKKESP